MEHIEQEHANEEHMKQLDPNGDLILQVGQQKLLVSAKILELSCPFFKKMLQPNSFQEGVEGPRVKTPPIKQIHEEHVGTFTLICRALHFLPVDRPESIDDYRSLADLCNFYGCARALSYYVRAWMDMWKLSELKTRELQVLLWVTFVFHLQNHFKRVSLYLAETMEAEDWKTWEVHPMPIQMKHDLKELCEKIKNAIQREIEIRIDAVCVNTQTHVGKRDKICCECLRTKPRETKRCGHCGSGEFRDYLCTREVRLLLFKDWLQSEGLWPLSYLKNQSCQNFLGSIPTTCIAPGTPCGFNDSCPLPGAKKLLIEGLKARLDSSVGLDLGDYDNDYIL